MTMSGVIKCINNNAAWPRIFPFRISQAEASEDSMFKFCNMKKWQTDLESREERIAFYLSSRVVVYQWPFFAALQYSQP